MTVEKIKNILRADLGLTDDEMQTLFPSEEELRNFYDACVKARKVATDVDEKVDNFDLSEWEKEDIRTRIAEKTKADPESKEFSEPPKNTGESAENAPEDVDLPDITSMPKTLEELLGED